MSLLIKEYEDFLLLSNETIVEQLSLKDQNILLKKLDDINSLIIEGNSSFLQEFYMINPVSVHSIAQAYLSDKKTKFINLRLEKFFPSEKTKEKYGLTQEVLEKITSLALVLEHKINSKLDLDDVQARLEQLYDVNHSINPYRTMDRIKNNLDFIEKATMSDLKEFYFATSTFAENIINMIDYEDWFPMVQQSIKESEKPVSLVTCADSFYFIKDAMDLPHKKIYTMDQLKKRHNVLEKYLRLD